MRIAYLVHQYLPEHIGGTEIYTHGLARRAVAAGHDVVVLTYAECPTGNVADFVPQWRTYEGVPVVEFPYNLAVAPSVARYEYDNPFVAAQVRNLLASWDPDVVHVTHAMKLSGAAVEACQLLGVPVVVTLCDFWFLCPRHTLLTWDGRLCDGPSSWRECLRCVQDLHGVGRRRRDRRAVQERWPYLQGVLAGADRVLALTPFLAGKFAANGFDPNRLEVVPHGVEPSGLRSPQPTTGPVRFVFIGSLVPAKGPHLAIAAVRSLPELDLRLTIHGRIRRGDPYVEDLLEEAAADVRITVDTEIVPEIGDVLAETDYLLLPALCYENGPLFVKQARHVGIPVIVSRLGSLIEMVEEDVDGWTVTPGDEAAWGAAITRAVEEHRRGRRWPVRRHPEMDDHFKGIETVYQEVVASRATFGGDQQ